MLVSLTVENYALIDKLEIEFKLGLNIITGETGAGKSILLGALGLVLGQRADSSSLKDTSKNCIIEATFDISKMNLADFFEANDIDYDSYIIIRRMISPNGKSRAFINDTPVNLGTLKDLGYKLIDIHSQHETLLLSNSHFQMNAVDTVANSGQLLADYRQCFGSYKRELSLLKQMIEEHDKSAADFDYISFQLQQLIDAKLTDGEQESLEAEERELENAESIKTELAYCTEAIDNADASVLNVLKNCISSLRKIRNVLSQSKALMQRLESASIEIKDIHSEIETLDERIEVNPERLQTVKERLDLLYTLQQKHRADSVAELISIRESLDEKASKFTNSDEEIAKQQKQVNQLLENTKTVAQQLTEKRKSAIPHIEEFVANTLSDLGMPFAKIRVNIEEAELTADGADKITFLFSANKQISFQEVAKVASGGEMSRLMLSIKTLLAKKGDLPTIIFDEIDTGVSGEVADKMGSIIKDVSKNIQVINITHLPQIASKGDHHFFVYKENDDTSTSTKIKLLNKEERITEIAKMLSGQNVTTAAIQNAKSLLKAQ